MSFKVGDRVVLTGGDLDDMYHPELYTEIVTISNICPVWKNAYELSGYEVDPTDGVLQSFLGKYLRKVDEDSQSNFKSSVESQLLADQAMKETVEYNPMEIPQHLEEV